MEAPHDRPGSTVLSRVWALLDEAEDERLEQLDTKSIMDEIAAAVKLINKLQEHQLQLIAHAEATGARRLADPGR